MLVEVIKGGAKREIHDKVAAVLIKQGHVREVAGQTYQTRDMKAENLAGMKRDELLKLAKDRGIAVHHRSGEQKLREALQTK